MNQRGFGFGAVLACIPLCLFAAHCDLPASQELNETLGTAGLAGDANLTGKFQLLLTDEPASFEFIESAVITISSIEVRLVKIYEGVSTSVDFCISNTCVNGACIPVGTNCDDGDACTVDACDSATGTCSYTPITCATDELCVEGQCLFTCANDAACDDGDPCTTEVCTNGACVMSDTCVSPDPCTNVSCNPNTGACIFVASICGPGQVCFGGGCVTPCGTDTDCDDGDMCTIGVCGPDYACEFTTVDCDDSDACTTDSCDPNTGFCANDPVVCAANEVCVDSICYTACVNSTECNGAADDDDDSDSDEDSEDDSDDDDGDSDSGDDSTGDDDSGDEGEDDDSDDGGDGESSGSDSDSSNDDSGGVEGDSVDEDSASDSEAGDDESIGDDSNNDDSASDDENADDGDGDGDGEDGGDAENGGIGDDDGTNKDLKNDFEAIEVDDVKPSLASDDDSQGDSGDESDGDSDQDGSGDDSDDEQDDSGDDGDSDDGLLTQKGDDSDDNAKGSFVVIFEGEKEFELLQLQNGQTDLLADADIPAGSYSQMRLIVSEGEVTLTDGRVFTLRVPGGEQTGIKLHFDFEVNGDEATTLLLDVDLLKAFQSMPGGQINNASEITGFTFRPSLAMRLISLDDDR